jgi:hypothetical protein
MARGCTARKKATAVPALFHNDRIAIELNLFIRTALPLSIVVMQGIAIETADDWRKKPPG